MINKKKNVYKQYVYLNTSAKAWRHFCRDPCIDCGQRAVRRTRRIVIAVDVLAEQSHFLDASVGEEAHFVENRIHWPRAFPAARERHDAIRAHVIAPPHNRSVQTTTNDHDMT